ncbi:MAG: flagellar hook-associated protein FlgL [Nitrospinae bacterium]|nr:flagellar hook-associated protein FlgL [Nitrospinota bacterium]MBI3814364.1 flagellar hook-associated protein FlgL [Nitrospinota bacterium]
MFRITNRMMYNNTLYNIFTNNEGLLKAQEELSSGKRINKPSDDPTGLNRVLDYRARISSTEQHIRNIDEGVAWLNMADSTLNTMSEVLRRAKEISVSQAGAPATAETRKTYAKDIDNIISQMVLLGNSSIGGKYIFAGQKTNTAPFASGAIYFGDKKEVQIEIESDKKMGISLDGSTLLTTDLSPDINGNTLLSSLNKGNGVASGSIKITNRAGNSATINLSGASTVSGVINAINAGGINITASINSAGNGISIIDNNSIATQNLTIEEVGGGKTASDLGILASMPDNIDGLDLTPNLTTSTPLSLLNGGNGLSLTAITVVNGAASGAISLSSATNISAVINAINNSGLNVTASIDSSGKSLQILSNNPSTFAYAKEVGSGTSASDLGISGGKNIIKTLTILRDALNNNDTNAIFGAIGLIDTNIDKVLGIRGEVGGRVNRIESMKGLLDQSNQDAVKQRSAVEDADIAKSASDLALFQTAYQATLQSAAKIIQPSLLDFIR